MPAKKTARKSARKSGAKAAAKSNANWKNRTVYTGDCLDIMRRMNGESVDLIYLDPPFNKKRQFQSAIGTPAEGTGFKDFWDWGDIRAYEADEISRRCPAAEHVIRAAFHSYDKSMAAYIVMMANRLLECRRVLKPAGSIYLHCDHTASAYLRLLMNSVFGKDGFMNDIVWCYTSPGKVTRHFPRKHDNLLFYAKGGKSTFNLAALRVPHKRQTPSAGATGMAGGGRSFEEIRAREAESLEQGKIMEDWWSDIGSGGHIPKGERVGYTTQKPLALLTRIIQASSNPGDIVLDPFCGCATTLVAAEKLGRQYVGIDISRNAAPLLKRRLEYESEQGNLGRSVPPLPTVTKLPPVRTDMGPPLKSQQEKQAFKRRLYGEQTGNCGGCKSHFADARHFHLDRVVPGGDGGTYHPENLQLLCGSCNSIKGARPQAYLMKRLKELGYIGAAD